MIRLFQITLLLAFSVGVANMQAQEPAPATTHSNFKATCESLSRIELKASTLGLPTNGARVYSAKFRRDKRGEYCKVLGRIHPIDRSAQDIRFEVNLPTQWNGKAVQFGGGAFDGWLGATNGLGHPVVSDAREPSPLARGFATLGGDSGHHKHYFFYPTY